jgi:CHAT domain-containing protein
MLEAADELPSSKAVLVFHLLPDRLLVWILRTGSLRLVSVPVGADELTAQIRVFRRALASGGEWRPMAEKLFEELFGPLGDGIEGAEDLVVIPDGAIYGLPLAALVNEESGRFLVEEFRISTSPLLSIALGAQRTQRFGGLDASTAVLAVANPWQPRSSTALPELPYAEMEVERISDLFPRTTILGGRAATKDKFLEEAQRSSVIHFAGHSVVNPRLPLLSSLVLSPGAEGSSSRLYVYELLEHRLEAPQLVVFSACSSRVGGAALTSLTDAVLVAGVPVAVGSLWNVADRPSAAFFERFYSELREGAEPIEALRATQLSLLRSSNAELAHPSTWAAFQASGVDRTEPRR